MPWIRSNYTKEKRARIDTVRGPLTAEQFQNDATMRRVRELEHPVTPTPPPAPKPDLTYEHVGISITNPGPADVDTILRYGRWARVGPEQCWNLDLFHAFTTEAIAQGLKVLACVQPCAPRYKNATPADYAAYADFALRVADTGIHALEPGNELNNKMFNDALLADCATLAAELTIAVATRVGGTHPDLPIITAGWSPAGDGPLGLYPQVALPAMLQHLGPLACKGYGWHAYEMSMKPTAKPPDDKPGWNACYRMRDAWPAIVADGAPKPFWVTEFGYHGSDSNQETWLRDYFTAFVAHRAAGVQIANVFWHTLYEGDSTTSAAENTMGLLMAGGSEKPAAVALREIGAQPWARVLV